MGGSVGLATVTTIATTVAARGVGVGALNHGFHIALYTLVGISVLGAAFAAAVGRPHPVAAEAPVLDDSTYVLEEAA